MLVEPCSEIIPYRNAAHVSFCLHYVQNHTEINADNLESPLNTTDMTAVCLYQASSYIVLRL